VRTIIAIKQSKPMWTSFCFLTGTMGLYNKYTGSFTPEVGSLYSFSKDWKPTKHISKVTVSNGLAWSEDLETMYYIDSVTKKVGAFDFDAENVKVCEYSYFNTLHENSTIHKNIFQLHVQNKHVSDPSPSTVTVKNIWSSFTNKLHFMKVIARVGYSSYFIQNTPSSLRRSTN
jgi:hypothetical protein